MLAEKFVQRACAIGLALALLAGTGTLRAQQQSSATALALTKELMEVKGGMKIFDPLVAGVVEQAKSLFLQTNPNLAKDLNEVAAQVRTEFAPRLNELKNEVALMYAQRFTEQEIKDTLAFYKSPLGKKLLAEEPAFFDQSMAHAQDWANKLSEQVIARMRAEMKKKGHDL